MKILFIYPNAEGYFRVPLGMSIIITILLEDKHQVEIFDTTFIVSNKHVDNIVRENAKLVLPVDFSKFYDALPLDEIDELLRKKIESFSPDLVAISIVEDNYEFSDHLLGVIKSLDGSIPVIAGGSTPTIAPEIIIVNPNIDYLVQGEGEEAVKEFCNLMSQGKSVEKVRNLWYKKKGKIMRNPLRHFIDMDTLPIQNLEIWDERHLLKPYCGKLYKAGYFEMSRGCLNMCSYCINHSCQRLLRDAGKYHRTKSIDKAMEEIKMLNDKYNFGLILFCDDNFLLRSHNDIREFAKFWTSEINVPFWINTAIESLTRKKLTMLKEAGCCGIGIGIESGSDWLRKNVLNRKTSSERMKEGFSLIHEFGIRTTGNVMIGFPGEYEEDIFETIKLVREIGPESYDLNFVAPYIGTDIYTVSKKLGYIDCWDKLGFEGMVKGITSRQEPVINIPHVGREKLITIFYDFVDYVEGRLSIPDKFRNPAPGSNKNARPRDDMGKEVAEALMANMMKMKGGDDEN